MVVVLPVARRPVLLVVLVQSSRVAVPERIGSGMTTSTAYLLHLPGVITTGYATSFLRMYILYQVPAGVSKVGPAFYSISL